MLKVNLKKRRNSMKKSKTTLKAVISDYEQRLVCEINICNC